MAASPRRATVPKARSEILRWRVMVEIRLHRQIRNWRSLSAALATAARIPWRNTARPKESAKGRIAPTQHDSLVSFF
jgi:hypothetical protein